jgi:hypothetical protein
MDTTIARTAVAEDAAARRRAFLFLQGPITPYFAEVAAGLRALGHATHRINLCLGDRMFWRGPGAVDFRGRPAEWPGFVARFLDAHAITDLVLLGEQRPWHRAAIAAARARGVAVTVTDYGYLRPDTMRGQQVNGLQAYPLLAFEEKPNEGRARELINTPGVAWNAGMFAWRRRAIHAAIERYTPLMTLLGAARSDLALSAAYDRITPISIDYAVMEGAARDHRVVMGSMNVGWSDLGSWTALLDGLAGGRSTGATGRVMQPGEHLVAGPSDLVVRPLDGRLVVEEPNGAVVADGVWAHLAFARPLAPQVRALLDRVQRQEVAS